MSNSVSQVDRVSDMAPTCQVCGCGGNVQKRDNGLCWPFCLGEKCLPALTLMPDPSISPSMPLVTFRLLHWCWSLHGVNMNKFVCVFLERNCLRLQKFLPLTQSLLGFATRSNGDLSSWHWNPGLGGLMWGWDSSLLRYPFQIFIHHTWMWD